jgi:hypothetical protein
MVQAAVLDGFQFDASPFGQSGFATAKIDVSQGEVWSCHVFVPLPVIV